MKINPSGTLLNSGYEANYARVLIMDFFVTLTALCILIENGPGGREHLDKYFQVGHAVFCHKVI